VWSHPGWAPLKTLTGHEQKISCVDVSPGLYSVNKLPKKFVVFCVATLCSLHPDSPSNLFYEPRSCRMNWWARVHSCKFQLKNQSDRDFAQPWSFIMLIIMSRNKLKVSHLGSVHTRPKKFENASTVSPTVHANPSRKRSISKTLFKPEGFENAGFSFWCGHKTFWKQSFSKTIAPR